MGTLGSWFHRALEGSCLERIVSSAATEYASSAAGSVPVCGEIRPLSQGPRLRLPPGYGAWLSAELEYAPVQHAGWPIGSTMSNARGGMNMLQTRSVFGAAS